MRTTLGNAAVALGICVAGVIVHHVGSPSGGALTAPSAAPAAQDAPWAVEGFRDTERCELLGDPPECR
jgi:hypothetical protein